MVVDVQETTFQRTLKTIETAFKVRDIASFDLRWCSIDDNVASVLSDPRFDSFDVIPVRNGFDIEGVIERDNVHEDTVSNEMLPIEESFVISAEESLAELIPRLSSKHFYLVRTGSTVNAIVTRSDIHKLPVRVYLFTLVTHLEATMAEAINMNCPNIEEWVSILSLKRQDRIYGKREDLKQKGLDPVLLELTDFCDKRDIVEEIYELKKSDFKRHLRDVEELRNSVAHAATYIESNDGFAEFVAKHKRALKWISKIEQRNLKVGPVNGSSTSPDANGA